MYGPTRASAPCPNLGLGRVAQPSPAMTRNAPSQAKPPRQTMTRARRSRGSSSARKPRQRSRSAGSGLFAGGAQRTQAVM